MLFLSKGVADIMKKFIVTEFEIIFFYNAKLYIKQSRILSRKFVLILYKTMREI